MVSLRKVSFGVIAAIVIIGGIVGIATSDGRPPIGEAPPINDTTTTESVAQSQSEIKKTYAVTATSADAINTTQLRKYGVVGTEAGVRIELRMSSTNVTAVENISWVESVNPAIRSKSEQTETPGSSNGQSLGVQQAHQDGITGEGVKVGIIDIGFDINNPAITSNIADVKSYRSTQGSLAHGTSVAETVVRTAPDSEIYAVSISNNLIDTERAIDYLNSQNVDVIVHSRSFAAIEDDGSHVLSDNINAAVNNGTLFVNSAGNEAQTHWEGDFRDTDGNDVHEWTDSGDELNCLPNCEREYSGDITVFVRWNDQDEQSQYRPALYNPVREEYIKLGQDRVFSTPTGTQYAVLDTTVAPQAVDLVIAHTGGPADDEIEVAFLNGPGQIERNVPRSSIGPPGDVAKALTVAAYERQPTQLAPYSSRGPTDDGRIGIDVTGYTNIEVTNGFYDSGVFAGTSAAAPYVGGVAALVEENKHSSRTTENVLKDTADGIFRPPERAGAGVVNATAAVSSVNKGQFQISRLNTGNVTVVKGNSFDINVTITNTGTLTDTQQVELKINGSRTKSVQLNKKESTLVTFSNISTASTAVGTYNYTVSTEDDSRTSTIKVKNDATNVQLENAGINETEIKNTKSNYTLKFDVKNLSPDNKSDEFTVKMPDGVNIEAVSIEKSEVPVSKPPTAKNPITFAVNPTQATTTKMKVKLTLSANSN